MNNYRLSLLASADLEEIAEYTIERFGVEQARRYRDGLKTCFDQLANNPVLGKRSEQLMRDLRRFEHQSHVVFYINEPEDIFIVRVLHSSMDVPRHF
ncbi:MAG: type II toxin-antitoxin system RelE/ParE family toxin [Xanthomonadales bacterium]|nr:type II toxin-antitoxin system RelE/ParE family toxin [Xanthomonadales bacterium]